MQRLLSCPDLVAALLFWLTDEQTGCRRAGRRFGVKTKPPASPSNTPNLFVSQHQADVIGVLCGLDRLRFKGCLPQLYCPRTMESYLEVSKVLHKDFKAFALALTQRIKSAAMRMAEMVGRPFRYLNSSNIRKETLARDLIQQDGLEEGLIGIFGCVEPCHTYFMAGNRQTKKLELKLERGQCQHFYFYHLHPEFGLMHLRLQSWFPFTVHICLNGRHWLSRQMDRHHMDYGQKENCFTWISHLKGAQRLMDKQLELDWPEQLDRILRQNHPLATEICRPLGLSYYWTTQESEYATDVMFKSPKPLTGIYPALVRHAITSFSSADVMRFLGHKVPSHGKVRGDFKGEVVSDLKERPEGIRVKHSLNANSIKMYDKQGSVLRIETTINQTRDFRVFREAQVGPHGGAKNNGKKAWRILRRGVVDLKRRAEVSRAANDRYLTALSATTGKVPLFEWADSVCKPILHEGRRARALNPWSPQDRALFQAVNRGEFKINGFRNRDLRALLFQAKATEQEQKRRSGIVTRKLVLLRAHGLIKKVSGTHRYVLTNKGSTIITALLAARQANINQLTQIAA
jgi:hypothetical protein